MLSNNESFNKKAHRIVSFCLMLGVICLSYISIIEIDVAAKKSEITQQEIITSINLIQDQLSVLESRVK